MVWPLISNFLSSLDLVTSIYFVYIYIFHRWRLVKWSAIFIIESVKSMVNESMPTVWHCYLQWLFTIRCDFVRYFLYIEGQQTILHWVFFFKLSDRLSDKLEGLTRQIWNLPEKSGSVASFAISAIVCTSQLSRKMVK